MLVRRADFLKTIYKNGIMFNPYGIDWMLKIWKICELSRLQDLKGLRIIDDMQKKMIFKLNSGLTIV